MLAEDLARLDHRHLRRDRPVRPDLQDQPVVVGLLADAGVLGGVADAGDRRVVAVDRDRADLLLLDVLDVLRRRDVAAALVDRQRHVEHHVVGQRRDHQVLVDHGDGGVGLDHAGGDGAGLLRVQPHRLGLVRVELHHQALDVQDNVGHVLHHPAQAGKLVLRALELDVRDRRAFQAAQQDAAEAVAHRRPEAALERLGGELAVGVGGNGLVAEHSRGQLQSAPTDSHIGLSFAPGAELREVPAPTVRGHLAPASSGGAILVNRVRGSGFRWEGRGLLG